MTFEEFEANIRNVEQEVLADTNGELGRELETVALRWVDDNFRNQGYDGGQWDASTGTILVKSGQLRAGFVSEPGPLQVQVINAVPYAKVHNEGLSGTSAVRAHERSKFSKSTPRGLRTRTGVQKVKAHSRKYSFKQRQFAPAGDMPQSLIQQSRDALELKITEKLTKS
jgi:phage gpG-like protein